MINQNNCTFRTGGSELGQNDVLQVRQLNMHHAKNSTELLNIWLLENTASKKGNSNIPIELKMALIQEPYLGTSNTVIQNFDKNLKVFQHTGRKKTRAGIITPKSLPFWLLTQFTNEDTVTMR